MTIFQIKVVKIVHNEINVRMKNLNNFIRGGRKKKKIERREKI